MGMSTILYVEDNADHRLMMYTLLTNRGFQVHMASNGDEGLMLAKEVRPDLILLDLYMPRMDGFTLMQCLEEAAATRDIPIIVVSAWPTGDHRRRARECGAVGFIAKPYDIETLVQIIHDNLPGASRPFFNAPSARCSSA
jgi:CheY-like chemotaxis protein